MSVSKVLVGVQKIWKKFFMLHANRKVIGDFLKTFPPESYCPNLNDVFGNFRKAPGEVKAMIVSTFPMNLREIDGRPDDRFSSGFSSPDSSSMLERILGREIGEENLMRMTDNGLLMINLSLTIGIGDVPHISVWGDFVKGIVQMLTYNSPALRVHVLGMSIDRFTEGYEMSPSSVFSSGPHPSEVFIIQRDPNRFKTLIDLIDEFDVET